MENMWTKVNWGPDEAKGDNGLQDYFLETTDYADIRSGAKRYIIGRKGSGKTAIIEKLKLDISSSKGSNYESFVYISLKDFNVGMLREKKDDYKIGSDRFLSIWNFIILSALAKKIVESNLDSKNKDLSALKDFVDNNHIDYRNHSENFSKLSKKKWKFDFKILSYSSEVEKRDISTEENNDLSCINKILFHAINKTGVGNRFYVIFDELDNNFSKKNDYLDQILALFRSVEDLFYDFNNNRLFFPVIAIREDIYSLLEHSDKNKYHDYSIILNWSISSFNDSKLLDLVKKRAFISYKQYEDSNHLWKQMLNEFPQITDGKGKVIPLWNFLVSRTFEKPRDIIKCCKLLKDIIRGGINSKQIDVLFYKKLDSQMSNWMFNELADELGGHCKSLNGGGKAVLQILSFIGKTEFEFSDYENFLVSENGLVYKNFIDDKSNKVTKSYFIDLLFSASAIGNFRGYRSNNKSTKYIFKYKDSDNLIDYSVKFKVHRSLYSKLNLFGK